MPDTIISYVKKYGNVTFLEHPLNDVDSLVLCQLAYLKYDGIVPEVEENLPSVSIGEVAKHADFQKLFAEDRFEKNNRALFQAVLESKRYGDMKLNCYINIVKTEWETQFSAVTFLLGDGSVYIAYRGTDETIVGWKEDFNMAFQKPIPAQEYSVRYLNRVAGSFRLPFYVGGHSKGGNLAIYASMNCSKEIQDRILKIYNMDGPGFRPEVLEKCDFEAIRDRTEKILPHSSFVGMIFERDIYYQVVESLAFGLWQHDPYTWMVEGGDFKRVSGLYESRKLLDDTLNEWVLSLEEEEVKVVVDTLFKILSASESDNLIDFAANLKRSMTGMSAALKEVDEPTAKMIKEILKSLFELGKNNVIAKIKSISEGEER